MNSLRTSRFSEHARAFSLIELLVTIGMIGILAALLLPALNQASARARRIYCVSALRQMGLAMHSFAQSHGDKFPVQVPGAAGGSLEFLRASSAVNGEFYFSYRHFLPLASELGNPRVLTCPADTRKAATNFATFSNENLSYFVGANPEVGRPDSVLSGDRNLGPVDGSVARVGKLLPLRWTEELHRFKGNVLFADGHVEQLSGVFRLTNAEPTAITGLLLPSLPLLPTKPGRPPGGGGAPVWTPPGGGGGGGGIGGSLSPGGSMQSSVTTTSEVLTNGEVSNTVISFRRSGDRPGFSRHVLPAAEAATPVPPLKELRGTPPPSLPASDGVLAEPELPQAAEVVQTNVVSATSAPAATLAPVASRLPDASVALVQPKPLVNSVNQHVRHSPWWLLLWLLLLLAAFYLIQRRLQNRRLRQRESTGRLPSLGAD